MDDGMVFAILSAVLVFALGLLGLVFVENYHR
jgi:hypothetical protein